MKWYTPQTTEELAYALQERGKTSLVLAGGTDLVIRLREGKEEPEALIWPGRIPSLRQISVSEDCLSIGSMATLSEIASALEGYPEFAAIADAASGVGSPQIRAKATMAGNLCNASPAGDMLPIALLYETDLEILSGNGEITRIPAKDFLLGPGRTALRPGQAVIRLIIDRRRFADYRSAFKKIGFRSYVSIARIGMGMLVRFRNDGSIEDSRITLGAVANTPIRVPEAEALLYGSMPDESVTDAVRDILTRTVHDNCRPRNRLYKTEAAKGLWADVWDSVMSRR